VENLHAGRVGVTVSTYSPEQIGSHSHLGTQRLALMTGAGPRPASDGGIWTRDPLDPQDGGSEDMPAQDVFFVRCAVRRRAARASRASGVVPSWSPASVVNWRR
jgi:hypothetical protein